jgi:hypothetical protein
MPRISFRKSHFAAVSLTAVSLLSSCGDGVTSTASSGRYWNVVMAGNSTARITFGTALSADRTGIIAAGLSSPYSTSNYSLYLTGGNTALGGPLACKLNYVEMGNTTVLPGAATGTFRFDGDCAGTMVSDLKIILGNSTAAILDANNNYIVEAGRSAIGTITAPGADGASTGNITY